MNIEDIKNYPTCYNDSRTGETHESMLRSFHALKKVLEMVHRGDSHETILEVANLLDYRADTGINHRPVIREVR